MSAVVRAIARSVSIAAGIVLLAGVHNASAQVIDHVEFKTSFPFTVGDTSLPAGSYTIRPDDADPSVFQLTGAHASVLFEVESASARETPSKTEVVFKRYGNGYVLKSIWVEGSNTGAETLATRGERRISKLQAPATEHRVAGRKKAQTANNR